MVDQVLTREVLTVTTQNVSKEDKALGAEVNRIMWKALAQADRYLSHGPESGRQAVVKAALAAATRLGAVDAKREVEVARTALLEVMSGMSDIGGKTPIYDAASHAPSTALAEPADDQDDC